MGEPEKVVIKYTECEAWSPIFLEQAEDRVPAENIKIIRAEEARLDKERGE